MKFRVEHVTNKKQITVPDGWKIEHTTARDSGGYSILMSKGSHEERHKQKDPAIGFDLFVNEDEYY